MFLFRAIWLRLISWAKRGRLCMSRAFEYSRPHVPVHLVRSERERVSDVASEQRGTPPPSPRAVEGTSIPTSATTATTPTPTTTNTPTASANTFESNSKALEGVLQLLEHLVDGLDATRRTSQSSGSSSKTEKKRVGGKISGIAMVEALESQVETLNAQVTHIRVIRVMSFLL